MKSKERTDFELYARIAELELLIKQTDVLFSIAEAGIKSTNLPELLTLIVGNIVQGTLIWQSKKSIISYVADLEGIT